MKKYFSLFALTILFVSAVASATALDDATEGLIALSQINTSKFSIVDQKNLRLAQVKFQSLVSILVADQSTASQNITPRPPRIMVASSLYCEGAKAKGIAQCMGAGFSDGTIVGRSDSPSSECTLSIECR